ncbi:MAG: hypothetical protein LIO90_01100 [Bacteroidales bacterium]|nr:hypothetical protein [Bacteroidales bacterium]
MNGLSMAHKKRGKLNPAYPTLEAFAMPVIKDKQSVSPRWIIDSLKTSRIAATCLGVYNQPERYRCTIFFMTMKVAKFQAQKTAFGLTLIICQCKFRNKSSYFSNIIGIFSRICELPPLRPLPQRRKLGVNRLMLM